MEELWREFKSQEIPMGQYEVIECIRNFDGTKITLESDEHRIILSFNFVDAFRICDEGRRIRTYNEISEIQKYREEFIGNPVYLVEKSEFIKWILVESAGFCIDVKHYAIATMNDIVDIITSDEPTLVISRIK
jgi:hypothetical protein